MHCKKMMPTTVGEFRMSPAQSTGTGRGSWKRRYWYFSTGMNYLGKSMFEGGPGGLVMVVDVRS